METTMLKAAAREAGKGAAHRARHEGSVPAVLYGHGVKGGTPIAVPGKELLRLVQTGGSRHLVELTVGSKKHRVMIKEIQHDAVTGQPIHVDFYAVSLKEKIHATVPVVVSGAEAVSKAGGIIEHQLHEVEVECLPADLPDALQVDIAKLGPGAHVSVGDITPPKGVKILNDADEVVLSIDRPRTEEEVPAAAAAKAEPELVKSKKEEE
ncbi:MAG: 50S ribosomal protein L25 [Bacillota bacterium]